MLIVQGYRRNRNKCSATDVPLSSVMKFLDDRGDDFDLGFAGELFREFSMATYDQPVWSSVDFQKAAVAEFRNQVELLCFEG